MQSLINAIAGLTGGPVPCISDVFLTYLGSYFVLTAMMARALRVWFRYLYSADKAQRILNLRTEHNQRFLIRRKQFTERTLVRRTFLVVAISFSAPLIAFFVSAGDDPMVMSPDDGVSRCPSNEISVRLLQAFIGSVMLMVIVTVWVLHKVRENYGIKKELAGTSALLFMAGAQSAALAYVGLSLSRFVLLILINLEAFNMVTWKVIKSYRAETVRVDELRKRNLRNKQHGRREEQSRSDTSASKSVSQLTNLSEVFESPVALHFYIEHLKREFSVENLLFYNISKEFAEMCEGDKFDSDEARNLEAASIYVDFVDLGGDIQVNIPANIFEEIQNEIARCFPNFDAARFRAAEPTDSTGSISSQIFARANTSIYKLMETDSFVRFNLAMDRMPQVQRQKISKMSKRELESRNESQLESQLDNAERAAPGVLNLVRPGVPGGGHGVSNGQSRRRSLRYKSARFASARDHGIRQRRRSMPGLFSGKKSEVPAAGSNAPRRRETLPGFDACRRTSSVPLAKEESELTEFEGSLHKVGKSIFQDKPESV